MTPTATASPLFAAELEAAAARPPTGEPSAVGELRRRAALRFAELGVPTTRQEAWRFTNLAAVHRQAWHLAAGEIPAAAEILLAPHRIPGAIELVFVNGRFASALSRLAGTPPGLGAGRLASALASTPSALEALGGEADALAHPFVALNTALFADGAAVVVPRRLAVAAPIHLLHLSVNERGEPTASFPRTLVVAGERSEVSLVETYVGAGGGPSLVVPVTEIVAGEAAVVDHTKVQREGAETIHLSTFALSTGRAATVTSHTLSLGGSLVRHDVQARLAGEGAEVTLNGLSMVRERQFVDIHLRVDHVAPRCASHELFKGILDGHARAVFNGRIHVHPGAQKTDAKQTSRNLLLSPHALVNANPQLEIFADDVKCTHGSTVGQLDANAIFYLRSRGIGAEAARSLLTWAFASDLVERVKVESVRRSLREFLLGWIPHGEVVREAT